MTSPTVSAGEAARRLGVAPITIQRWVDSGVLQAERTPGGHRRIYVTELRRLIAASRSTEVNGLLADWLDAMRSGDPSQVRSALLTARQKCGSWASVADEVASVIAELGREWEAGTCQIFEEHAATETLRRGITLCGAGLQCAPDSRHAVLCTVEGERHTLGLSLAELLLVEAGWRCSWIGEGPPSEELQSLVTKLKPDLLVVSASSVTPPKAIARYQAELDIVATAGDVEIVLAGSGAWCPTSTVQRLITFSDLRTFLCEKDQLTAQ